MQIQDEIITTQCVFCGIWFGITQSYFNVKKRTGHDFYCPNGHSLKFINQPPAEAEKKSEAENSVDGNVVRVDFGRDTEDN